MNKTVAGGVVARYKPTGYSVGMRADHEGGYVQWHEYDAMQQRCAELQAELSEANDSVEEFCLDANRKAAALEAAQAEADRLRVDAERSRDWIADVLADMETWAQEMARTENPGHHRLDKIARRIRAAAKLDPRPRAIHAAKT